jgi:predicted HD superfamily hydrolase involved in NAD metabolism
MGQFDSAISYLEKEIEKRYSGKPLARHTRSVAEFARRIAGSVIKSDSLAEKAYVAGLAHDLYKGFSQKDMRELVVAESVPVDEDSLSIGGGLLHAPLAAHYIRTRLKITDDEILSAVYYHTTGRLNATTLDKILFCADYLDPWREIRATEPDVPALTKRVLVDLEEVYRTVLYRKLAYTLSKGQSLHPNGVAAWNQICLK